MGVINQDNFSTHKVVGLTAPVAITGDTTSGACDLQGFASATFYVYFGADTTPPDGSNYWACKLTECDTSGGSYTDVAAADVIGSTANAFGVVNSGSEDEAVYALGYKGSKRYVKVVVDETGTVSTTVAVFAVLGDPAITPAGNTVQGS